MSDYSELIARLRSPFALTERDAQEVADALEAQAKEIADKDARIAELETALDDMHKGHDAICKYVSELEAALKPFAYDVAECFQDDEDTEITVKIRDLRAASAALKGEK